MESIKLMQKTYIYRDIKQLEASKDLNKEDEVKALKVELSILEEKLNKLLDLYLEAIINKDTYSNRKLLLEEEVNKLQTNIAELSRSNNEIDQLIQSKRNLISHLNDMKIKESYTSTEILKYISSIKVIRNELLVTLNIEGQEVEVPQVIVF